MAGLLGRRTTRRPAFDEAAVLDQLLVSQVLDAIPLAIFVTDRAGRFLSCNKSCAEWMDRDRQDIIGCTASELVARPVAECYTRRDTQLLQSSGRCTYESRLPGTGHVVRDVLIQKATFHDAVGRVRGIVGVGTDISAQKQNENALRISQQRLQLAIDAAEEGTWDWRLDTNEVYFSDRWYQMLGYAPGELPMSFETWPSLLHPDDLPAAMRGVREYLAGARDRFRIEFRLRTRSAGWKWVLGTGEVVERDDAGRARRMVGVHFDIDDLKRAEQELAEAKEAAESANRAKSEFLANMSHEIRTPMTAILGYADLLRDSDLSDVDRNEFIEVINQSGRHLLTIINDILDLSKIEAGQFVIERQACDVPALIEDVIALVQPRAARKGITLDVEYATPIPVPIWSDAARLRQIVLNLASNSVKFTDNGRVTISVGIDTAIAAGGRFAIAVTDTGIGIAPDVLGTLFRPFTQADPSTSRRFGGTGLGLTISRRLARMLGGDITAVSTPGVGSTFTLTVDPGDIREARRYRPDRTHITASCRESPPPDHFDGRVLIVDDEPVNQTLIQELLRKLGVTADVAGDGREACTRLTADPLVGPSYDLVLMDMQMPVMDGYTATRQLRASGYGAPIVALTAQAASEARERCLEVGCTDYLSKPVDPGELRTLLSRHLRSQIADNVS